MGARRHHRVSGVAIVLAWGFVTGTALGQERSVPWPPAELPAYPSSPFHGVVDGNGQTIPCRCRFQGRQYHLGETVCMSTHVGIVIARCDLMLNNTSWVPTPTPCTLSSAEAPGLMALAR